MKRSRWSHKKQTKLTWLTVCLLVLMQIQLLPAFSVAPNSDVIASEAKQSKVSAQYASLPLAFEPNQGQVDPSAQFLVHHGQATTYFDGANATTTIGNSHITMSLDSANTPTFTGTDQLESKTNYFIGNDQSKWQSDVPNYKQLLAKNVYPGIDLKYYGTNSQLEHDFIVSPGADYKQIAFHFDGQEDLALDADGNLILTAGESNLKLNAPTTYQQTANTKHTIPSHFELDNNTITIALSVDYDHSQSLIIDPALIYSTYLGGSGTDAAYGIAVDANGNTYVSGQTASSNFPTASPFQGSNAGGNDAFVTKFNAAGSALVYSTYLGGTGIDVAISIAVDSSSNAYIAGATTSTNFPTASPFQGSNAGGNDAFITKLNAAGSALVYSTYLGGTGGENGSNIAVDAGGNAYVSGQTISTNFPTASPFQGSNAGGNDAFITKLNAAGSALVYSTYLGGTGNDGALSIAVDANGNAYVSGQTISTNFPTASPFQGSNAGGQDAFITKLNAAGSALVYSTYLGGIGVEYARGIAIDASSNAYLSGYTTSTNFPTASPFQGSNAGGNDAFITKLNAAGSALVYSTYIGGIGDDKGYDVAVDSSNNAYFVGVTDSTDFPIASPFQSSNAGGADDAFVAKLNPAGSALVYSTYIGGIGGDYASSIAVSLNGNTYVSGQTDSTDFPTASPFQVTHAAGFYDAFVTQLSENTVVVTGLLNPSLSFSIGATTCNMGMFSATQTQYCTHTLTAGSNATGGYVISYIPTTTLTSGANTIDAMAAQGASVVGTEQFGMNLKANTSAGSFTAANFGADPSGGTGAAMTGYQTADLFKFATGGNNIAQTTGPSTPTTYTASFITNITIASEAGTYSTPVTYNVVASY